MMALKLVECTVEEALDDILAIIILCHVLVHHINLVILHRQWIRVTRPTCEYAWLVDLYRFG